MRDAGGKNPLDEETGFCDKCKTYLNKQGWL
jgi:archaemetzincin